MLIAGTMRTSSGSYDGFFSLYDYTSNLAAWTVNMVDRSGSNYGYTFNDIATNGAEIYLTGYRFSTGSA